LFGVASLVIMLVNQVVRGLVALWDLVAGSSAEDEPDRQPGLKTVEYF